MILNFQKVSDRSDTYCQCSLLNYKNFVSYFKKFNIIPVCMFSFLKGPAIAMFLYQHFYDLTFVAIQLPINYFVSAITSCSQYSCKASWSNNKEKVWNYDHYWQDILIHFKYQNTAIKERFLKSEMSDRT